MAQNKVQRVTCVASPASSSMTYRDCESSIHQVAKKHPCCRGYVDIANPAVASSLCIQDEPNDKHPSERLQNTTFFFCNDIICVEPEPVPLCATQTVRHGLFVFSLR